jgi:uncharacterized membrane protein
MSSIADLADLIASRRAKLERAFRSELLKLRATYGTAAVAKALELAREAERHVPGINENSVSAMTLKQCRECGGQVSTEAEVLPPFRRSFSCSPAEPTEIFHV